MSDRVKEILHPVSLEEKSNRKGAEVLNGEP